MISPICNVQNSTAVRNNTGIKKVLKKAKGFFVKPKSAGECLARIKEKFGAIEENMSERLGERIYKTSSGNRVRFISCDSSNFSVSKILNPKNSAASEYEGQLAEIISNTHNWAVSGDKNLVCHYKSRIICRFDEKSEFEQGIGYIRSLLFPSKNEAAEPHVSHKSKEKRTYVPYEIGKNWL